MSYNSSTITNGSVKGAAAILDQQLNLVFKQMHTDFSKFGSVQSNSIMPSSSSLSSYSTISPLKTAMPSSNFSTSGSSSLVSPDNFSRKRTLSSKTASTLVGVIAAEDEKPSASPQYVSSPPIFKIESKKKSSDIKTMTVGLENFGSALELCSFFSSHVAFYPEMSVEIIGSHIDDNSSSKRVQDFQQTFSLTDLMIASKLPKMTVNSWNKTAAHKFPLAIHPSASGRDISMNGIFSEFFEEKFGRLSALNVSSRVVVNTGQLTTKLRSMIRSAGFSGRIEINYKFSESIMKFVVPKSLRRWGLAKSAKVSVDAEFQLDFEDWLDNYAAKEISKIASRSC